MLEENLLLLVVGERNATSGDLRDMVISGGLRDTWLLVVGGVAHGC